MEDKYAPQAHDICDAVAGGFFADKRINRRGVRDWDIAGMARRGFDADIRIAGRRMDNQEGQAIMATEILVPQLGNEVSEAEVTEWAAAVGDSVSAGEVVVVISTTKAALEIESPVGGTLSEIRIGEGELTEVGAVLGIVE